MQAQLATGMAAILGGGWQPAPGEGALDEDAAWAAWDSAPDPVSRAARFGLPAFRAAQAAVLHLIRLGGQRATSLAERQMLAGHHAAVTAAAANLPGAGDDGVPVGDLVRQAAGPPGDHPRPSLLQVAAHLATAQRQALLIGPDRPGARAGRAPERVRAPPAPRAPASRTRSRRPGRSSPPRPWGCSVTWPR